MWHPYLVLPRGSRVAPTSEGCWGRHLLPPASVWRHLQDHKRIFIPRALLSKGAKEAEVEGNGAFSTVFVITFYGPCYSNV